MPGGSTRSFGYFRPYPLTFEHGEGSYLWDLDGNRYVDFTYNGLSLIHGHAFPPIEAALQAALPKGTAWPGTSLPQVEFAEALCDRMPAAERVRFTNTGTEAGMLAVKLARHVTGRPLVVKSWGAYHGSYDDLEAGLHGKGEVAGRTALGNFGDLDSYREVFERHRGEIAAVIIEPILFTCEVVPPPPGFLPSWSRWPAEGRVVILDDCLMFRLAEGGSAEKFGIAPDLTCLGKFIGGGLPVGVVGGTEELLSVLDPNHPDNLYHGGSFNGNPLGATAGRITVEHLSGESIARWTARPPAWRRRWKRRPRRSGCRCGSAATARSSAATWSARTAPRTATSAPASTSRRSTTASTSARTASSRWRPPSTMTSTRRSPASRRRSRTSPPRSPRRGRRLGAMEGSAGSTETRSFKVTCDVGGTFTDVVATDSAGRIAIGKSLTTPHSLVDGLPAAIGAAAEELELSPEALLARRRPLRLLDHPGDQRDPGRRTARTALLCTEGFPDILVRREGGSLRPYDFTRPPPEPYVPRRLTFEVPERIGADGEVVRPLDEALTEGLIHRLAAREVEAVAVCLLWSVVNPAHELRLGELLEARAAGRPLHALPPAQPDRPRVPAQLRRRDRRLAEAADAGHLREVEDGLRALGFDGELLAANSLGGVMPMADMAARPIYAVRSGPSLAPVAGRAYAAAELDQADVIVCDTGGTSFDVSLVRDGEVVFTRETWLGEPFAGHLTGLSSVDVRSIGAGGGSIAWIDSGGLLRVGPQSAGADPGPACYGNGGERADRDRRRARARLPRPRPLPRRPDDARRRRRRGGGGAGRRADRQRPRGAAARRSSRSPTSTWSRRSRRSPSTRASTRATAPWSPAAAPPGSGSSRSPASSAAAGC